MTQRHIELYNYLLSKDGWTMQDEIGRELFKHFGNAECFLSPEEYHDTSGRNFLSQTIREINESPDFEKIIISSARGVKVASEAEFDRYIKNQYRATIRKLSRIYKMAKKGGRDKQIDFGGNTVEAFLQKLEEREG